MPKPVPPVVRAPTSINIDSSLWQEFKVLCAYKKKTLTEELERMIRIAVLRPKPGVRK